MYMYIKVTQRLPELLYTFTFLLNLLKQHALKGQKLLAQGSALGNHRRTPLAL
jgi:hypothetical protein